MKRRRQTATWLRDEKHIHIPIGSSRYRVDLSIASDTQQSVGLGIEQWATRQRIHSHLLYLQ